MEIILQSMKYDGKLILKILKIGDSPFWSPYFHNTNYIWDIQDKHKEEGKYGL